MSRRQRRAAAATVDLSQLSTIIQTIIEPKLFRSMERLCTFALTQTQNNEIMRAMVSQLSFELKSIAISQYGHDTPESIAFSSLLKRTNPNKPEHEKLHPVRQDPLLILANKELLSAVDISAAAIIREMWQAFSRFLSVTTRSYERSGGTRSKVLQPMDVMGEETWETWNKLYRPWYAIASRDWTCRAVTGRINNVEIILKIVIEEYHPFEVDVMLGMDRGASLDTLKLELGRFFDPVGKITPAIAPAKPQGGRLVRERIRAAA